MALQPDTDAGLGRSVKQLRTLGARLLLAGGILFAIGLLLMRAGDGVLDILGTSSPRSRRRRQSAAWRC